MKKVYVLIYSDNYATRDQIKEWANKSTVIHTWRYDLPNCIYLVSDKSAAEIDKAIEDTFGRRGRYLITEITENRQGFLPMDTWHLFSHKEIKS